jgi:hypothetical protein
MKSFTFGCANKSDCGNQLDMCTFFVTFCKVSSSYFHKISYGSEANTLINIDCNLNDRSFDFTLEPIYDEY